MDVTLYGTNQIVFVLSIFLGLRSLRGTASAWHFMFPRAKILAGISFYPPNLEGCQFWLKAPLHLGSAGRKLPNWQKRSGIHRAGKQSSLFKDRNLGLNGESEHGSFFCPCRAKDCGGEVMMEDKTLLTASNNGLLCWCLCCMRWNSCARLYVQNTGKAKNKCKFC